MNIEVKCLLGFHWWSDWIKNQGVIYAYRYCSNCGKIDFNWIKWAKESTKVD